MQTSEIASISLVLLLHRIWFPFPLKSGKKGLSVAILLSLSILRTGHKVYVSVNPTTIDVDFVLVMA